MDGQTPLTKKERRELRRQEKLEKQESIQKKRAVKKVVNWGIFLVIAGLLVWGFTATSNKDSTDNNDSSLPLTDNVTEEDQTKGSEAAPVVLLEYSDFQCPACKTYHPILGLLTNQFSESVKFVYRHFPLETIHKNARLAAEAAEAAGKQGKFWEMHDFIFENQEDWADLSGSKARETFIALAGGLGLDSEQFEADLDSDAVKGKVSRDIASGRNANVTATPTFFLNGERIQNPTSYEDFKDLIEEALLDLPEEVTVEGLEGVEVEVGGEEVRLESVEAVPQEEQ